MNENKNENAQLPEIPVLPVPLPEAPSVIGSANPEIAPIEKKTVLQTIALTTTSLLGLAIAITIAGIAITIAMPIINIIVLLLVAAYALPVIGALAFVNVITTSIVLLTRSSHSKWKILNITALAISVPLAIVGCYLLVQLHIIAPINDASSKNNTSQQGVVAQKRTGDEITKENAITLLQACELKGFYYTDQTKESGGGWGELSTTGVVLTKVKDKPYRISIAERHEAELVPIAREAQKTCTNLQFWHDGSYEQRQADGTWQ